MMKKKIVFMLAAILLMAGSAMVAETQAAVTVVVNDGFDDGDRTNGADTLDVDWWTINEGNPGDQTLTVKTDDGTPAIGSGNALEVTHVVTDNRRGLLGDFSGSEVTLSNTGDSITLEFSFRILSSSNSAKDFRFGLLDNGGTLVTGDRLDDNESDDDQGYYVRASTGSQDEWTLTYEGGEGNFLAGGDMTGLLSVTDFGGIDDNLSHTARLTLTKNAAGTIDIEMVFDEGTGSQKSMIDEHTGSEGGGTEVVFTFNEIGFSSNDDDIDYIIDNVVVEFAELLEPIADAGADDYVWLADATAGLDLIGLITNYDPLKSYTYTWSGAGVSFSTPVTVVDLNCPTTATFPGTGTYTLTLEATNSYGSGSDTVTVSVLDPTVTKVHTGHWDLDDGGGNTVADSSTGPFDHSGTLVGDPNWVDGWVGCAGSSLEFYGSGYATFSADTGPSDPNGNLDNIQYGITIAAWVNTVPNGKSQRVLIKDDAFELRIQSDGTVRLKIWTAASDYNMTDSDESDLGENLIIADGKWHHVAATYSAVDEMAAIYVDGILIHSEEHNELIWLAEPDKDPNLYIGQNYVGGIDDVQLYSYALDSTAIEALAAMGDTVPLVYAGPNDEYMISDILLQLQGSVGDLDSTPVIKWTVTTGTPASVTFTDDTDPATTVEFDPADPGLFVLQLSATDTIPCGEEVVTVTDTVTITTALPTCAEVIEQGLTLPMDVTGPVEGQPDCYVDMYELAYLANFWMRCNDPENQPLCEWAW